MLALAPQWLGDINTEPVEKLPHYWSTAVVGDYLYFPNGGDAGVELWRTDGTEAGTELVADVFPGPGGSFPQQLTAVGDQLFFVATDGQFGLELWRTNGTAEGTIRVSDIEPGLASSMPEQITLVGASVFFTAFNSATGRELWTLDGSSDAPALVRDVQPGEEGSDPDWLTAGDGFVYFSANDGVHGRELWRSDGTPEGTTLVVDLDPGVRSSSPGPIEFAGGSLYFAGYLTGNLSFRRLWKSDGVEVQEVRAGPFPHQTYSLRTEASEFVSLGDSLYLSTTRDYSSYVRHIWRTDGSFETTFELLVTGEGRRIYDYPDQLTVVGEAVFFLADGQENGVELWRTNAAGDAVQEVVDIVPQGDSHPEMLTAVEESLFFTLRDSPELWFSDGTSKGTTSLHRFDGVGPIGMASLGDQIVVFTHGKAGHSLWISDGTKAGTTRIADLQLGTQATPFARFVPGDDEMFFAIGDGKPTWGLWKTDGSAEGTSQFTIITQRFARTLYPEMAFVGDTLFFRSEELPSDGLPNTGAEIWKTDGTAEGRTLLVDLEEGWNTAQPEILTSFNGKLIFMANEANGISIRHPEPPAGAELWFSDGTADGTQLLIDLVPGIAGSWPHSLTQVGDELFFMAQTEGRGTRIWSTDGTAEGTQLVERQFARDRSMPQRLTAAGDALYYFDQSNEWDLELWGVDADEKVSQLIKSWPLSYLQDISYFFDVQSSGDFVYFVVHGGTDTQSKEKFAELWRSDGTEEGTIPILQMPVEFTGRSYAINMEPFEEDLVFNAPDVESGWGLWRTDGTPEGTHRILQGQSESSGHSPRNMTNVHGTLFFSAYHEETGRELWKSDGTAEGTVLFADLFPGDADSAPSDFIIHNGVLYFTADDGFHGRELWRLEPAPGDTNFDGAVDLVDFSRLKDSFGREGENLTGDLNFDNVVDLVDFSILKTNFGVSDVATAAVAESTDKVDPDGDVVIGAAIDAVMAEEREREDA